MNGSVAAAAGQPRAARAEVDTSGGVRMTLQDAERRPALAVPQTDRLVASRRGDQGAVGADGDPMHHRLVTFEHLQAAIGESREVLPFPAAVLGWGTRQMVPQPRGLTCARGGLRGRDVSGVALVDEGIAFLDQIGLGQGSAFHFALRGDERRPR